MIRRWYRFVYRIKWTLLYGIGLALLTVNLFEETTGHAAAVFLVMLMFAALVGTPFWRQRRWAYASGLLGAISYAGAMYVAHVDFFTVINTASYVPIILAIVLPNAFFALVSLAILNPLILSYSHDVPQSYIIGNIYGLGMASILSSLLVYMIRYIDRERQRYREMSIRDSLTGLATLEYALKIGQQILDEGLAVRVLVVDLDHFKQVNDTYGHIAGNRMLVRIGAILSEELGSARGIVGRLGGDEFVVIAKEEGLAPRFTERLHEKLRAEPFQPDADLSALRLSFSIGEASSSLTGQVRMEDVLTAADQNMYLRKYQNRAPLLSVLPEESQRLGERGADLLSVLAEKDMYTFVHSQGVSQYAVMIAKRLSLSLDVVEALRVAGWLHDIGKVLVPTDILRKPSALTPAEYELVKRHVMDGLNILSGLELAQSTRVAILYHHERWDGKGYPKGVKGAETPLEGRILQVADAFSAMTVKRVYREQMLRDEALRQVQIHSGSQFDPDLAQVFIDAMTARSSVSAQSHAPAAIGTR